MDLGLEEAQHKKSCCQSAWYCHCRVDEIVGTQRFSGNDNWPVVLSHACATREQRVLVCQVRIRVERNSRDLILAFHGLSVQSLDIVQRVNVIEIAGIDLLCR